MVSNAFDMSVIGHPVILLFSFEVKDFVRIWFRAVVVLWPFLPPWWLSCIILFFVKNGSRWVMKYSSIIFSIVLRLLSGLYDPMSYMGFPCLSFGVILSILKMSGNFLSSIICFIRWVMSGAIILVVFLIIFIEMLFVLF